MANPRVEELPDEAETTPEKKAEVEDASDSSGSEVEAEQGGEGGKRITFLSSTWQRWSFQSQLCLTPAALVAASIHVHRLAIIVAFPA